MLQALSVRNFKNLARIPEADGDFVHFGPLNVLIGPNGCGKSSLLQAMDFLRAFFMSSVEVYLTERGWDYRDLPNLRQTQKAIHWKLKACLPDHPKWGGGGEYLYTVTLQPRRFVCVGTESLTYTEPGASAVELLSRRGRDCAILNRATKGTERLKTVNLPASVMSQVDPSRDAEKYPELLRFRDWVQGFRLFLLWDPKILRNPDRGKHEEIGPSGEHLASVLGRMRERNPEAFERLVRRMRSLFPTLTDVSVSGKGWGWRRLWLHEGNGREVLFKSQQMSDGILRVLAICSILYQKDPPSVVMFEEPENGIHPRLIREVVQMLRELTLRKPPRNAQVFFSTHSPYVLDEFYDHPEEVYCMERSQPQSGARIVRLSENRQLKDAIDIFGRSLGEAWTTGLISAGIR